MSHSIKPLTNKKILLLPFLFIVILASGCAGPKVAADLLANVENNDQPLVNKSYIISAEINPGINNNEGIDQTVKESLEIALTNANIFNKTSPGTFRINADVLVASQAAFSFGSFEGKLRIKYVVFDDANKKIIDEEIYTEAGSDIQHFSGAARHRRARAVNISLNVRKFVELLQSKLKK